MVPNAFRRSARWCALAACLLLLELAPALRADPAAAAPPAPIQIVEQAGSIRLVPGNPAWLNGVSDERVQKIGDAMAHYLGRQGYAPATPQSSEVLTRAMLTGAEPVPWRRVVTPAAGVSTRALPMPTFVPAGPIATCDSFNCSTASTGNVNSLICGCATTGITSSNPGANVCPSLCGTYGRDPANGQMDYFKCRTGTPAERNRCETMCEARC